MSKTTVKDPWCQLAGGYKCFLDRPRYSLTSREIIREVVPKAASKICRFGGQIEEFYSLAQHVCGVESWVQNNGGNTAQRLQALLHDSAEAILGGDIPKPVREKVFGYDLLEDSFLDQIMRLYELPVDIDDLVWDGDVALLVVEAEQLLEGGPIEKWTDRYLKPEIDRTKIVQQAFVTCHPTFPIWTFKDAERNFRHRLDSLTQRHLKEVLELQQKDLTES